MYCVFCQFIMICHCFCLFAFPLLVVKLNIFSSVYLFLFFFVVNCHFFYWVFFLFIRFLYQFGVLISLFVFHIYCNIYSHSYFALCIFCQIEILNSNVIKYICLLSQVIVFNVSLGNFSQLRYKILLFVCLFLPFL